MLFGFAIFLITVPWLVSCLCTDFNNHTNWKYLPIDDCGMAKSRQRIVGGKVAALGQYPWMARLGYEYGYIRKTVRFQCGGTLINDFYVITAAHCLEGDMKNRLVLIRLGENYISSDKDCEEGYCAPPFQDVSIEKIIEHEDYNDKTLRHDLALIRLEHAVTMNDYVKPVCLPRDELLQTDFTKEKTIVTGWGLVSSITGQLPSRLMYVGLPIVDTDMCETTYQVHMLEGQICAGAGGGKDSCVGDSGGPMVTPLALDGPTKYYQIGVVSYGAPTCGYDPAVYTNITHYMPWILHHVRK